jgi:hypothetical protein
VRFSVDPWDPSYGAGVDAELGTSDAVIDAGVEVPVEKWAPVAVDRSAVPPETVLFVDGVRRIDAQVWIDDEHGGAAPGICASYAAGVVCCRHAERAHLVSGIVGHGLFTTAVDAEDIETTAGRYTVRVAATRPGIASTQLLSLALQRRLAEVELLAAGSARQDRVEGDLLVVDGPLHGRHNLPHVIGLVKSHRKDYLEWPLNSVVADLEAGERTPAFLIRGSWERYSWYLRLPCPPGSPWAGIVRIECNADLPISGAVFSASLSQVTLPRFASTAYKDPRAPQNLHPIGGLERELRHRLGDPGLRYRALKQAAHSPRLAVVGSNAV